MVRSFTHDGPGTPASEWAERPEWEHVPSADLDGFDHVLVVAAHPDDETLGAGGLIATAAVADLDVHLFVCTAGEHSHPNSTTHRPEELATRREDEVRAALGELAPSGAGITLLNVEDGHLDEARAGPWSQLLVRLIKDGRRTLIVAPWRHDGHPDHDAAGRAAATTARRTGATLWEYPIWWWHWARPGDAPWDDLRQLDLTDTATRRRRRALDPPPQPDRAAVRRARRRSPAQTPLRRSTSPALGSASSCKRPGTTPSTDCTAPSPTRGGSTNDATSDASAPSVSRCCLAIGSPEVWRSGAPSER